MEHSLAIAAPIALVRPRGAHRFEAYSPKLARRVSFNRRLAFELWLLLEADSRVTDFCERPGCVLIDGYHRIADFWVRFVDSNELVILDDCGMKGEAKAAGRDLDSDALPIRHVAPGELAAARVWTANWQRMLPYLIVNRGLVPTTLAQKIVNFVGHPQRLLDIEREFAATDSALVRAALFGLLHSGRVKAPELQTQQLSLLASFVAVEGMP